MRHTSGRTTALSGVIVIISVLFALAVASPAWGADFTPPPGTVTVDGGKDFVIGNPQSSFDLPRKDDLPNVPGSLFQHPDDTAPSDNKVTVGAGTTIRGHVYGGIASPGDGASGNATGNTVTVNNSTIGANAGSGNVHGGWSHSGSATGNAVTITDSIVRGLVIGGWVRGGTADGNQTRDNTVTITSGDFSDNVYGGFSQGSNGVITENKVIISGGTIEKGGNAANDPHIISGGYSSVGSNKEVSSNSVTISGGSINNFWIYGGRGQTSSTRITDNTVTVSGGSIGDATLNHTGDRGSYIYGGEGITGSASVDTNHVVINGGDVKATIYGGYARAGGAVTDNTVDILDGTVQGDVYGGYSVSGAATDNTVTVGDATFNGVNVYGGGRGANSGADVFSGNTLNKNSAAAIGTVGNFATVTFDYNGNANIARLDTTATGSRTVNGVTVETVGSGNITFGGVIDGSGSLTKAGAGTLILTNDNNRILNADGVTVREGRLEIGDGEDSGGLYTSRYAVGTADTVTAATLAYNRDDEVFYGGLISGNGKGTLEQMGGRDDTGTLILTGDGSSIGNIKIIGGTLQLGDGGTTGSITAAGSVDIDPDATLAYKHSDSIEDSNHITGAGKVVQRGDGTLRLNDALSPASQNAPRNTFTGGTEIQSGRLEIIDQTSYNTAVGGNLYGGTAITAANRDNTHAGYITFTGAGAKSAALMYGVIPSDTAIVRNSFRTAAGAGSENSVDLSSFDAVTMDEITLNGNADKGGAFYVANGTAMTVSASRLGLGTSVRFNTAQGLADSTRKENDLYVEQDGSFTLYTGTQTVFNSGIDGEGTLNLYSLASPSARASVYLANNANYKQTFAMGTTNVEGKDGKMTVLYMGRGNIGEGDTRVTFRNEREFNLGALSMLSADGTLNAGEAVTVTDDAIIFPHAMSVNDPDSTVDGPGTLKLIAPEITLTDFSMGYEIAGEQTSLADDGKGLSDVSNNSLLDFETVGERVTIDDGAVYIRTTTGKPVISDDYLVMRSNYGFQDKIGDAITAIGGMNDVNEHLTAYIDGFVVSPGGGSVRGTGMTFDLGGDPDVGGDNTSNSDRNIWLTTQMDSLSMTWTGGDASWVSGDLFLSEQGIGDAKERSFLPGDKVYLSGANDFAIALPTPKPAEDPSGVRITVSGLVVGKDVDGNSAENGSYTISGGGGIKADAASAHGQYRETNLSDDAPGENILHPTGKLEKFGDSTLTFTNTGDNLFLEGVDLHGGTTRFTRANQLGDDSFDAAGALNASANGTQFLGDATLEALNDVTFRNSVTIADGVTGAFGAAANTLFTYDGQLSGDATSVFAKIGEGTVRLSPADPSPLSPFVGTVDVRAGTLDVTANYGGTAGFAVRNGATLSGTGTLGGGGGIRSGGLLKPGGLLWSGSGTPEEHALNLADGDVAFNAGSGFAVRLAEYYGNGDTRYSDLINVSGGTVAIDPAANLTVAVDYYKMQLNDPSYYTIIDAAIAPADTTQTFAFNAGGTLPRGLTLEHGWGLDGSHFDLYQIGQVYRIGPGYGGIPDGSHNENEIGKVIDWLVDNQVPGMDEVEKRLQGDDEHVRKLLDRLHGDLAANALYMAFKEPWRHPFNRLEAALSPATGGEPELHRPRVWAESSSRYQSAEFDGNAHGFTLYRHGAAFGVDTAVTPHSIVGAAFRYTRPHLSQTTGEVVADDYEAGLYGMAGLPGGLDMKLYLGWSHQEYEFDRVVSLPAPDADPGMGPLRERLSGETGGNALAASVEVVRPVPVRDNFRLTPVAALDYEKVWMDGFGESGGQAALRYGDSSMDRLTARAGLKGEYIYNDKLDLKAWAQYAHHVSGRDYPETGARFANVTTPGQPVADIHGSRTGRHYINLGFGANWKLDEAGDTFLYMNYDAKLNNRMTDHTGEIGFMIHF